MDAPTQLWEAWRAQVKQLFPSLHGHQQKTLAWMVLGVVLSGSAVLQRMRDRLVRHWDSQDAQHRTAPGTLCRQ